MDLTTMTPPQIDELWAPLAAATNEIHRSIWEIQAAQRAVASGWSVTYQQRQLAKQADQLPTLEAKLNEAVAAEEPFQAEWNERKGWTRAYLVITNGTGHVHRSTNCSTCYPTTSFEWLIDYSGASEQEIVDAAGERACTVCYASAPVALRIKRPTQMFGADEKRKQAERVEREQKRAQAATAHVEVEGYRDGRRVSTKTFKTERAATNEIASTLSSMVGYGPTHPTFPEWQSNVQAIIAGLAAKGVEFDYDAALEKARKKCRAEHAKFRKTAQFEQWAKQGLIDEAALVDGYDPAKF